MLGWISNPVFAFLVKLTFTLKYYVNIYYFKQRYNDCFYKILFLILFCQPLAVTQTINLQPLYLFTLVNRVRSRHCCQNSINNIQLKILVEVEGVLARLN